MTQKNTAQATNQTAKAKAGANTGTGTGKSTGSSTSAGVDANVSTVTDMDLDLEIDNQNSAMSKQPSTEQADTILEPAKRPNPAAVVHTGNAVTTLSPEVIELVAELRDTVQRINPSRHTAKTLRRVLSNVNDILRDISTGIDA